MAQYNKSWGSVSSDFKRTTGFQSETKRISKQAEDQFRKEKDQLASMKEVAAHNSRADRSAASFADKAANYELQALSKFSNKLNSFLQTTAAEWAKEEKAKDINRKIDQIKKDRVEYNKKSGEIRSKIEAASGDTKKQEKIFEDMRTKEEVDRNALETAVNKIAENNAAVQNLQKDLEAHRLTDPNDPDNVAKLSGNEKIAYYAVTAEEKVKNAAGNYHNYIQEQGDSTRVATWKDKVLEKDGLGNDVWVHPTVKVKDIVDPKGKQFLKDEFRQSVMNDMSSQLGGIKEDYRILLLDEPLTAELDSIQATEVQNYKKDKHKDLHASSVQGVVNSISGTPPFNSDEAVAANVNSAYASTRSSWVQSGQGSAGDGLDNLMETALSTVLNKSDPEDMDTAFQNYLKMGDVELKTGPHKGEKFSKAHPNRWNEHTIAEATAKYAKKRAAAEAEFETVEKGIIKGKIGGFQNKLSAYKAEMAAKNPPVKVTAAMLKAQEAEYYRELYKEHPTTSAGKLIFQEQNDSRVTWDDNDWENEFKVLGEKHRGVIPTAVLQGMPEELQKEFLKKYSGWRIVDQPAAHAGHAAAQTEKHLIELEAKVGAIEVARGQLKPNDTDSVVVRDMVGDLYERELNRLVYEGEDGVKLNPVDAGKQARKHVLAMLNGGEFLADDKTPNPLYSKAYNPGRGQVSAWSHNKEIVAHQVRGDRLSSGPLEDQWTNAKIKYETLSEKGPVDLSKTYLFNKPELNENYEVQNIEEIKHLLGDGLVDEGERTDGSHAITETYRTISRKEAKNRQHFLHKQRLAVLKATSPDGDPRRSTLHLTHKELVKNWFTSEKLNKPIGSTLADRAAYEKERAATAEKSEQQENARDVRIQEEAKDERSNKQRAQDNLNESGRSSGVYLGGGM